MLSTFWRCNMLLKLRWDKPALQLSGSPREALIRSVFRRQLCDTNTNIRIELYLITLFDGHQILARIAFPFPHRVHTGDAFAHQEDGDRARIPSKMQSEGCYLRQV
jgi:hypothetical protein